MAADVRSLQGVPNVSADLRDDLDEIAATIGRGNLQYVGNNIRRVLKRRDIPAAVRSRLEQIQKKVGT